MPRTALLQELINRIGVPVQQQTVTAGGIRTSYLSAGAGEPVVLLHGGDAGAGAIRWLTVIGPLSAHFCVIAPDLVGFGESEKPPALYDRPYFSSWLEQFLAAISLHQARLVGHSLGGAVALQFTIDNPQRVDRLVLVNAAGLGPASQRVPASLKLRMILQNLVPTRASSKWFLEHHVLADPANITETMLQLEDYSREIVRSPGGRRVFWQGRGRAAGPIPLDDLARVPCPTLLIWGEDDPNFPLASAQTAVRRLPRGRLKIIHGARHACFVDQPELFNDTLLHFLAASEPG